jgi:FkbM family methyltransferase
MKSQILKITAWIAGWAPNSLKRFSYRLGPISKLIRKQLNNAAPSGITKTTIAGGISKGLSFYLEMQSEKDYWLGNYELNLQNVLGSLVSPGMVVYDIGANVGYVSVMFGRITGAEGSVFCFEALPENQNRLNDNLELNKELTNFVSVPIAVADKSGKVSFMVHNSDDMGKIKGSSGREETYQDAIEIDAISIDDFVFDQKNTPPNLIKLDIEGGEIFAIPGMMRVIHKYQPTLIVELHGPKCAEVAWEFLASEQYTIHQLEKGFPQVSNFKELDWKSYLVGFPK